ncbi:MAG: hypothetical protein QM302_09255 [Acidobacteriota bacterium]|nr:hypothetical protein [Acidobacteriota bacterium]
MCEIEASDGKEIIELCELMGSQVEKNLSAAGPYPAQLVISLSS